MIDDPFLAKEVITETQNGVRLIEKGDIKTLLFPKQHVQISGFDGRVSTIYGPRGNQYSRVEKETESDGWKSLFELADTILYERLNTVLFGTSEKRLNVHYSFPDNLETISAVLEHYADRKPSLVQPQVIVGDFNGKNIKAGIYM